MATKAAVSRQRWLAPEVVQTSAMDCGPAALKCLLEGFHIPVSYDRLREACQTDVDGTSIDVIEVVANQLGVQAEQVMLPLDYLALPQARTLPAIVVVRQADGANHFVVVWRRVGRWLQVMDPAVGRRWVPAHRFLQDVFVHSLTVPATDWRQWAGSDDFTTPLRAQLGLAGVDGKTADGLLARCDADPLWFSYAALDASSRFVRSVVRAGGLSEGAQAAQLIVALFEQTLAKPDDIFRIIAPVYWSAQADHLNEEGRLELLLRGAVMLRIQPRAATAEGNADEDEPADALGQSIELNAALADKPVRPWHTVWQLLRLSGRLGVTGLAFAMAMAAAVVVIEIMLFRGLFDVAWSLHLPGQRLGALVGLGALVALLMLVEVPIVTESMRLGRHLELRLRMALLQKLPRISDRYFQSRPVSDMAERSHSIHVARQMPAFALQFIQLLCDLGFTLLGIAFIDMASLGTALTVALLAMLIPWAVQPLLNERDLRVRNHSGALHVFNLDALLGLVPIRTHGAQPAVRRQHEALLVEWTRSGRGLMRLSVSAEALQSLVCTGLVAWLLVQHFLRTGTANGGDLLLVYWALKLPALGQSLTQLAHQYPSYRNVLLRLLEPLSAPDQQPAGSVPDLATALAPSAGQPASPQAAGVPVRVSAGRVVAAGHTILDEVNLSVAAGEHVAIVGSSGAGKSTLLGLLLGWHRLAQGELTVDVASLSPARLDELRRTTAWVDPSVQIWNRSFADNLSYASDPPRLERLGEVMAQAQLRGVLQKLPDGLQTWLGEGGALLSGGEGQRVRLARALAQTGVRLALLDEPFRGLDRQQRTQLLADARQWWQGATLLCVTHDVAETLGFPRVLVIEDGRIVEDGRPADLAACKSRYRELLDAETFVRQRMWQGAQWRHVRVEGGRVVPQERAA